MKPLTIEQLKSLEVGDWVWLIYKDTDYRRYAQIQAIEGTRLYVWGRGLAECEMWKYSDYGTKWLAYKNKEQAESKGEIVELPCKVGDTIYVIRNLLWDKDKFGIYRLVYSEISITKDGVKVREDWDTTPVEIFDTEFQAEARLKELRGEK